MTSMVHHGPGDRASAESDAAKKMRVRLHDNITAARAKSTLALERIEQEIPNDLVIHTSAVEFSHRSDELRVSYKEAGHLPDQRIHPWALGQMCEAMGLPRAYLNAILKRDDPEDRYWGAELAAKNLEELFKHADGRNLVRSYNNQTRGFLSPRYQRRHPGKLIDMLIQSFRKHGLIAYDAWCSDTKHGVRAVLDRIVEPVPNECLGVGVYYAESPFGNGATELSIFIERMWCTNLAVMEQTLRTVHLGGHLQEDIAWSEKTYQKDTDLVCSKLVDLLESTISENAIRKLEDGVKKANAQKLQGTAFEAFLKKHLSKEDAAGVLATYRGADVEMLPPGNTVWRASNAISFFGGKVEDEEKKFEIQKIAGKALTALAV